MMAASCMAGDTQHFRGDLHVHSRWSDGSHTVSQILEEAVCAGLTHLAFAEHDSTAHTSEAISQGQKRGIGVIPAVELSACDPDTGRKVHILGYSYGKTGSISALTAPVLKQRHENCQKQIGILSSLGYRISETDVLPYADGGILYKQHILKYLQDSGQTDQLFGTIYRTIFKNGGPCDFDINYAEAEEAVRAVCDDGGFAVLAHPGQQKNLDLIPRLAAAGLAGIELFHPANTAADQVQILELASRFGLFCTGGSDFHGSYENGSRPLGSFLAPPDCPLLG